MTAIEIVDPRPDWPDRFARLAGEIARLLGPRALRIDHIGSTAVPGLSAKDVVDIQVAVASLDPKPLAAELAGCGLAAVDGIDRDHLPAGTVDRPQEWAKLLFVAVPGGSPVHVHVRRRGAANWRYALLFRDYLRAEPATVAAYAELKRRLAGLGIDRGTYSDVKDPACDLIMAAAERWAVQVGWTPEPAAAHT